MLIEFNLIGKLLSKSRGIGFDNSSMFLVNNSSKVKVIDLENLLDFPKLTRGIFGHHIELTLANDSSDLYRFVKKTEQNRQNIEHLNLLIKNRLQNKIELLFDAFNKKAVNEYLRDSSISFFIDNGFNSITQSFLANSEVWNEKLDSHFSEKISNLSHYSPLEFSTSKIREMYEDATLLQRKSFYDQVESNPLTFDQRLAVIKNNDRNLVLAAAGTGKTSVMVAKALDLIDRKLAKSSEILVLAFNNSAAKEVKERLVRRAEKIDYEPTSLPDIKTFHALGLDLLRKTGNSTSMSVFTEDTIKLKIWISNWLVEYIQTSDKHLQNFIKLSNSPTNPFDFANQSEYEAYIRDNEFRTLNGERVKGYQELLIANWLFMNGVEYEYEPTYLAKRRIEIGFDYRPDFQIKGTKVYIEHFGIDRLGKTRSDINSASYNESMRKKRLLHQEFETVLLETYHYDWVEGNLENSIENQLIKQGIELNPISSDQIFERLKESGFIEKGVEMYLKSLQAIRTERLNKASINSRLLRYGVAESKLYTEFLGDLLGAYQEELTNQDAIDFDDMILKATQIVEKNQFKPAWKHILVDEFQDISAARMAFLKSLVDYGPGPILTVVGDDWQSIYRFTGGKLELTTRFNELVGSNSKTMLQKTFRYNNSIAEIAGRFVMKNPEQYEKHVKTHTQVDSPQVFLLDSYVNSINDITLKTLQVISHIKQMDPEASIAILARYNYLINNVRKQAVYQNIKYWTFHRSKGLEADYCILIGFSQGKLGFPNSRKDEQVVEALLPQLDGFKHSEERRLLYVAITRAKKRSYIIADSDSPSEFILEMLSDSYPIEVESTLFSDENLKIFKCPSCSSGYFKKLTGKHGPFYKCSSGNACSCKPRVCIKCGSPSIDGERESKCQNDACGHTFKICPKCGRPMKIRNGPYGSFWGCSGYGSPTDQCSHTEKLNRY